MNAEGMKLLKSFEGCRLKAYKCPAGIWTIGYGHTGGVKEGMTITQEEAEEILKNDLRRYENYVKATKLKLNENQHSALVSFTYNCGSGCLQTLVKNRTLNQIADAMLKYNKAGGKELAGLTKRRKAERDLFLKVDGKILTTAEGKALPYQVKTKCALNIRTAAGTNYPIIKTVKKGTKLTVWAECTSGGMKWGKNGNEWYCLNYCEEI